ncbi:Trm112 family protein [Halorhodospira halochloris]|uniref:Trm112 family protein n=1 Tax=Halorhodospira halochloris TaxID=1052 RepID=UPI001EE97881|nr:Trm112 family protein [Halorhodospira halochloris]
MSHYNDHMDRKLLNILCCPVTKRPLEPMSAKDIELVNRLVREGKLNYFDDAQVEHELSEALVTDNRSRIYPVEDGIPVMLEERGIPGSVLQDGGSHSP